MNVRWGDQGRTDLAGYRTSAFPLVVLTLPPDGRISEVVRALLAAPFVALLAGVGVKALLREGLRMSSILVLSCALVFLGAMFDSLRRMIRKGRVRFYVLDVYVEVRHFGKWRTTWSRERRRLLRFEAVTKLVRGTIYTRLYAIGLEGQREEVWEVSNEGHLNGIPKRLNELLANSA